MLAAILFFETQGFTSILRYWAVAERFRSRRFGAAVMRHYLAMHSAVRRFLLWVVAANDNAVRKYQHYGYAPDGLLDQVLVNELVTA
jgi:ribosomal protein S18 acetylase RimI-like enzyme